MTSANGGHAFLVGAFTFARFFLHSVHAIVVTALRCLLRWCDLDLEVLVGFPMIAARD